MKIAPVKHDLVTGGVMESREFSIKTGAHIMAVLSGLYSNPVDAMVREYLTNMFDAHVAMERTGVKSTLPPVLEVPTALSPLLIFRDNGIGMSRETVMDIYSQYGNTTKSNTNLEVGGFGLGSKTAFCYNDGQTWNIESRFDGMKHLFLASLSKAGIPTLFHTESLPTQEHSGVTISIPIRREDFHSVNAAVAKYIPYFPIPIKVVGIEKVPAPITYFVQGSKWGVRPSAALSYRHTVNVVMGNVPYEVVLNSNSVLDSAINRLKLPSDVIDLFTQCDYDLYVDIGAVDIVPSRDSLKATERTILAIAESLKVFKDEVLGVIEQKLDSMPTEWDAHVFGMTLVKTLRLTYNHLMYKGTALKLGEGLVRQKDSLKALDPNISISVYALTSSTKAGVSEVDEKVESIVLETPGNTANDGSDAVEKHRAFIVIDDLGTGSITIAKSILWNNLVNKNKVTGRAYRYGHTRGSAVLLKTKLTPAQLSEFFGGFPVSHIYSARVLKDGGIIIPQSVRTKKDSIYKFTLTSKRWEARVFAPTDTNVKYYVPLAADSNTGRFGYEPKTSRRYYGSNDATMNLIRVFETEIIGKMPADFILYGVKSDDVAALDTSIWKNLETELKAAALDYLKKNAAVITQVYHEGNTTAVTEYSTLLTEMCARKEVQKAEPLLDEWQALHNTLRSERKTIDGIIVNWVTQDFPIDYEDIIKFSPKKRTVATIEQEIVEKYPMIKWAMEVKSNNYYGSSRMKFDESVLLDYMKSV